MAGIQAKNNAEDGENMIGIKTFNAVCANVADEDEVLTLGVGDDAHDPDHFFIIGRFDEDDLAIDECIGFQSDDTAYELAAAIEAVTLSVDTLTIRLNEAAAQQAGYREYCAKISAVQNSGELQAALLTLFSGSKVRLQLK